MILMRAETTKESISIPRNYIAFIIAAAGSSNYSRQNWSERSELLNYPPTERSAFVRIFMLSSAIQITFHARTIYTTLK